MKANELMIGDWVFTRGQIEQVTSIYDGYICTEHYEDSHDYYFEPIPLTPEVLEKNGFENQGYFSECILGDWRILCDTKNVAIIHGEHCNMDTPIEYVHELQHALRLCGIDKEIQL